MIHELAIDPELVVYWGSDRNEYRYIFDKIGLGQPRILSEYPKLKHWRREVLRSMPEGNESLRMRVEELVRIISECLVKRECAGYEGNRSWLENAETEHGRCPFHLILSKENPRNFGRVVSKENVGDPKDTRFRLQRTLPAPRTPEALAQALSPMLTNCSKAYFIDPHFDPNTKRYQDTMEAFFRALVTNRPGALPSEVKVIGKYDDSKCDYNTFEANLRKYFRRIVPRGLMVNFVRAKENPKGLALHNRFILTDIGGVYLGHGLDRGEDTHSEDIALLEKDHYLQRWKEYVVAPAFGYDTNEPPIVIGGGDAS